MMFSFSSRYIDRIAAVITELIGVLLAGSDSEIDPLDYAPTHNSVREHCNLGASMSRACVLVFSQIAIISE
jgi:hypothetical protein